jgi:hypothetical protein
MTSVLFPCFVLQENIVFSCDKKAKRQSYYLVKKKTNSRIPQCFSEENIHYWGEKALSSCV